jgi:hypothetical protein
MVFGFPGRTNQYLPSPAVEQTINTLNPAKIEIRDKALKILDKHMRADAGVRLKYASKFASVANYWKKWIGERTGLISTGALKKKYDLEAEYEKKAPKDYKYLVQEFKEVYGEIAPYALAKDFYSETASRNIEILRQMGYFKRLVNAYEANGTEAYSKLLSRYKPFFERFYKNYEPSIDQEVFGTLTKHYVESLDRKFVPTSLSDEYMRKNQMDYNQLANDLFTKSNFPKKDAIMRIFMMEPEVAIKTMKEDPMYQFYNDWNSLFANQISAPYNKHKSLIDSLQRLYMKGQMLTFKDKRYWPDANSTMRVT